MRITLKKKYAVYCKHSSLTWDKMVIYIKLEGKQSGKHTPDVSGQVPCMRPNMFPQALDTAAILASTGRLWMTNDTSLLCCRASVWACPRMPNPVMSVAAWALKVCMRPAAKSKDRERLIKGTHVCVHGWRLVSGMSKYVLFHFRWYLHNLLCV